MEAQDQDQDPTCIDEDKASGVAVLLDAKACILC